MSEMKPCPFCGGPVELERTVGSYERVRNGRPFWGVVCRNTINLGGTCAIQQIPSASEEAAIERWNRRAQLEASADAEDAERYRHLRELMQFSTPPGKPTTMKLRAALPAPEHQPHRDWMGEHFDASVDRTVDADIRACLTAEEIPAFDASRQAKEKGK